MKPYWRHQPAQCSWQAHRPDQICLMRAEAPADAVDCIEVFYNPKHEDP
jgi:hypothetical protein